MISYITIFGQIIPFYGILFFTGLLLAGFVGTLISKKRGLPKIEIVYSAVFMMIGGLAGSKLLFIIVSLPTIIEHRLSLMQLMQGGFVFYGGLIGGLLGLIAYVKIFKMEFFPFADVCAAVLPLGHAIGRLGCYTAGCCYGIPYDGVGAVVYTETLGHTPLGTPLLPIQLIEAICLLLLWVVLMVLYHRIRALGLLTGIYVISYGILRFILEFFRGDLERGHLLLSTSQWISILIVICGIVLIGSIIKQKKALPEAHADPSSH